MTPVKITAKEENKEDRLPPSIVIKSMSDKYLCTIWGDGSITFNPEKDYDAGDLERFIGIGKHFFTIYNSLIEKDSEIEVLKEKNKVLMRELMLTLNPVNERQ